MSSQKIENIRDLRACRGDPIQKNSMSDFKSTAEVLRSSATREGKSHSAHASKRSRRVPYLAEWGLFFHDLLVLNGVFYAVAGDVVLNDLASLVFLPLLSLIVLSFFLSENLYSYHVLFFSKLHVSRVVRALAWGGGTVFLFFVFLWWPAILDNWQGLALILLVGLLCTVANRFLPFELVDLVKSLGLSFLAVGFVGLVTADQTPGFMAHWLWICLSVFLAGGMLLLSRFFMVHFVFHGLLRRHFRRQVVVVGSDKEAKRITDHVIRNNAPFWIAGFVGVQEPSQVETVVPKRGLGVLGELPYIVAGNSVDEIIVTDENIEKTVLVSLLDYCTAEGIAVWFPPDLLPIIGMKLRINQFCGLPMVKLCSRKRNFILDIAERALDIALASLAILLFLPFFCVVAAAVKLSSPGPVFYKARAIGRGAKEFDMYKFRSMRPETCSDIHKSYVTRLIKGEIKQEGEKPLKICDDPRVTRIGKWLRKFSLDELPQIINVVKGDMSLVGPRPCLPYEYEVYKDWHKQRTTIRPGISGLWQVAGRSSVAFDDMILLDLYYIYNRSVLMYMNILYETLFAVLEKRGAY